MITAVETSKERKPIEDPSYVRPQCLDESYRPTYNYPLPEGITQPDSSSSTWNEVRICSTHLTEQQEKAMKDLCFRYSFIFNEKMGCVREAQDVWLSVPVSADLERMVKSRSRTAYSRAKWRPSMLSSMTIQRKAECRRSTGPPRTVCMCLWYGALRVIFRGQYLCIFT